MLARLLTYNIRGWRTLANEFNLEAVAQVIADTGADIVALNEVFHPQRKADNRLPENTTALAYLAQRLDMHYVFGPCLRWPATQDLPEHSYGNALLSRWPIIASAAHHLTPVEGKEQRGLLEGRILLPDNRTFTVYVTHLDHTDEAARMTQLRALRSWTIRDRNRPHVVMGDFNAIHSWDYEGRSAALETLADHPNGGPMMNNNPGPQVIPQMEKAGYTDALRQCGESGQGTFIPAADPLRIDYIWLSEPLASAARRAQIWTEAAGAEASDHRPVLVELDL
ncbi:MAG: endonuclease/exonuclease/phosphatase family protein [Caldilineaceae bacterium]|nr:endonuclease/exonuclease/phosphatase family protein [Caldilineaceae bacterium]